MNDDYSFFLFCKLFDTYHPSYEEYDLAYDRMIGLFNDYTISDCNIESEPEYECMEKYIMHLSPDKLYNNE